MIEEIKKLPNDVKAAILDDLILPIIASNKIAQVLDLDLNELIKKRNTSKSDRIQRLINDYEGEKEKEIVLSEREQEVVRRIANGVANSEIAKELGISSRTVDAHRYNVMRKIDVTSTAALVKYAIRVKLTSVQCSEIGR